MMGKLEARDNGTNRQFKAQIYQSRRRGQSRNFYNSHSYDRGNYQGRCMSNSGDRRIQFSGQGGGRPKYEQKYRRGNLEAMSDHINILGDRIVEENIEVIIGMKIIAKKEAEVGLEKDHFQGIIIIIEGMIET